MTTLKLVSSTYEPSLELPTPPGQARTYLGSAINEMGFIPLGKYGPTGDAMMNSMAVFDEATPNDGCNRIDKTRLYGRKSDEDYQR